MKKLSTIIILCFCAGQVSAQRYPFYNLSVEDGLVQSQVRALAQDKYGHLWVGTLGGLSRYDGSNFTNLNVRNGMLDNNCTAIATDKDGNIWLGGPEGISRYNGKSFEHFQLQPAENTTAKTVRKIIPADNILWCHTDHEVYSIKNKQVRPLPLPDSGITVTAVFPAKDTLWVATKNGCVYRYYNQTWDSIFFNLPGYPKAQITTTQFFRDSKKRLLLTTGNGLFTVSNDSLQIVWAEEKPVFNITIRSIAEDTEGALWLGTVSGAYRLTDTTLEKYGKQNGFTDNSIYTILTDKEGSVWFGSDGQGLYRFSGAQFSILDEHSDLPSEQVMSFAPTPSGKLYVGTSNAGLYLFDKQKIIPISLQYKAPYISALYADGEYDIWIGTQGNGLCRLKGQERIYYSSDDMPPNSVILSLLKDTSGRLWIGMGNGAMIYQDNQFAKVKNINGSILSFLAIGEDSMLLASESGLFLYHNGAVAPFTTGDAADGSNILSLAKLGDNLWLGSNDNGVICYNLRTQKSFTLNKGSGLQSDFVYNIIIDNNGDVWAGTGYGIHRIRIVNGMPRVTFYGKEQGITGMESNQNAVCRMPDGTLWFGTTKGAVHIDPDKKLLIPQPISVVLQSVKVFGDDIRDTTYFDSTDNWYNVPYKLRLPHKKNNITFTFKGITLSGNEQLQYRYRIDGLDAPWSDWTPLNSVTYSALPPGKYTLRVESRTMNSDEMKTLSYPFEIITPLHKTTWFSLMIFIACILAGVSIQYILNRRKQNRLALVEQLRREEQGKVRQRTAEDFHDEVGNKLTRINVLTNVLKEKLGDVSPDKKRILEQIQDNTAQLYGGTRDILWSLQESNDNLYEILNRIRDFGNNLFADTHIRFEFTDADNHWHNFKLPLDMSRNLIMIFKEALNNCLKYADASEVKVAIEIQADNVLHITLTDNGKGFNVEEVIKGNGLNNMRNRSERLKGKLYIDSTPGKGTIINLRFRLQERKV